jgi:predicted MFS family arabinose efflux permease
VSAPKAKVSAKKIGVLSALYFAQGLPYGFQSNALTLYLTSLGVPLGQVGLTKALALPWSFKALWAPLVDRLGSARFGRRKSWIVPMQALLAAACVVAAFVPPETHLKWLLACVLAMNFFAATQDIAVDGLAVDLLSESELGAGNAAQVVGYKVGMLTGGGLLVGLSASFGWQGLFFAMAALCLAVMTLVLFVKEPSQALTPEHAPRAQVSFPELWQRIKAVLRKPGAGWVLLAVATYKAAEALAESMFGPYLIREHGIARETVATWLGSWGMVGSIAGSFLGGALATRLPLVRALGVASALRALPLVGQWAIAAGLLEAGFSSVVPVTVAEHFFGGILTTVMFAFMMSQVDRAIGATHYTLLASVEVIGKSIPGLASGFLVERLGFAPVFLAAVALAAGFMVLLVPLSRLPASQELSAPS